MADVRYDASMTIAPITLAMSPTASILLWAGVLIVLAMIGGFVIMLLRRRLLGRDETASDVGLMDQLRGMVERGEMTREEFDLARRKIVERAAADRPSRPGDVPDA